MVKGLEPSILGKHAYNRPDPFVGGSPHSLTAFKGILKNPEAVAELALRSNANAKTPFKATPGTSIEGDARGLDQQKKITRAEAEKSAQEMVGGLYANLFKSLFEEIVNEDDSDSYGMAKQLFMEEAAKVMGRKTGPIHEKLIQTMMKGQANDDVNENAEPTEADSASESLLTQKHEPETGAEASQTLVLHQSANGAVPAGSTWPVMAPPKEYWGTYTPKIREAVHVLA